MTEILEPIDVTDKLVFDPDTLCHVMYADSEELLCGTPNRHRGDGCGKYGGEAICPTCGRPTCPTCALVDRLDDTLDEILRG